jgi:uncharacterized protein YdaU (DUF1376 family)
LENAVFTQAAERRLPIDAAGGAPVSAWYAHYPGDYGRDTAHLSLVEHGAYRLLLDHYYATAAPLPTEDTALYRICRAFDETERKAVDSIVRQFFTRQGDGYHNSRADAELQKQAQIHERLANAGRKRWHEPKHEPGSSQAVCQAIANPHPHPQPHPHKEKRKSAAAPPADPRYGPFLEFAKSSFETKHKHPPTWDCFGKDGAALAGFLRRAPHVTLDVWQAHISSFFDSTEAFTVKQGGSLAYFVSRFDTFSSGPILEKHSAGGSNGKPSTSDNIETTLATMRAAEQRRPN